MEKLVKQNVVLLDAEGSKPVVNGYFFTEDELHQVMSDMIDEYFKVEPNGFNNPKKINYYDFIKQQLS